MTGRELRSFYDQRKASFSSALASTNKKIRQVSNLRLTVAVSFILIAYFGFSNHALLYALLPLLALFAVLMRKHSGLFSNKTHLERLIDIQKFELYTIEGEFSHNSNGAEFINVHHPYSHDLDVFGEGSLFQYINRSNTREGKALMAERLSGKPDSIETVRRWQDAIAELARKPDFRQEVQALSMQIDEQPADRRQLEQWLTEPSFVYGKNIYRLLLTVFPPITVILVVLAFFIEGLSPFAILAAGFQWVFLGFHLKRINQFHQQIGYKKNALEKYARILNCVSQENHTSPVMQAIGKRAGVGGDAVEKLAALVRAFDARSNSMTNLVVNSLLLYDLQCVYRLEKWKSGNAPQLINWLDTIKETETLCSFATFAFNNPQFIFPALNEERVLEATGLGHPLLLNDARVANDVSLGRDASVMIITGANMAGKSTFLRTLGANVVLALAGAPVCAVEFTCPFLDLRTGMRTADSLKENQSYFYAELDRLKSIMDELRSGKPLFILLDEILKGTNSNDKQAGSVALISQLVDQPCLVAIATHDLALGEMENTFHGKIINYSFEANIKNDQLSFDYKLKRGVAQTMNATFLMRKMGIIGDRGTGLPPFASIPGQ